MPTWIVTDADNFDAANTADIAGSTLSTGGHTWEALGGSTGAIGRLGTLAEHLSGVTKYAVNGMSSLGTCKVEYIRKGVQFGITWRIVDTDNYYMLYTGVTGTEKLQFWRIVATVFTKLADGTTTVVDNDVISVEAIGSDHTVKINGTTELTVSDASHASGRAGLWSDTGSASYLNDFAAYQGAGSAGRLIGGGLVGGGKLLYSRLASGRRRGDR